MGKRWKWADEDKKGQERGWEGEKRVCQKGEMSFAGEKIYTR